MGFEVVVLLMLMFGVHEYVYGGVPPVAVGVPPSMFVAPGQMVVLFPALIVS